jgi:hypothetical protein
METALRSIERAGWPHANPIKLVSDLNRGTNDEWVDWDPAMLRDALAVSCDTCMDKIMACQVAATNPDVFHDWDLFYHACTALNHHGANFGWMQPPEVAELAWACYCLRRIQPNEPFGGDVEAFIKTVCTEDGLVFFPWTGGRGLVVQEGKLAQQLQQTWEDGKMPEGKVLSGDWESGDPSPLRTQVTSISGANAYIAHWLDAKNEN